MWRSASSSSTPPSSRAAARIASTIREARGLPVTIVMPADAPKAEGYELSPGNPAAPAKPLTATESAEGIEIDTGVVKARVAKSGRVLIPLVTRAAHTAGAIGELPNVAGQGIAATVFVWALAFPLTRIALVDLKPLPLAA